MTALHGDRELLRRARSDPDAIGVLFRRHAPGLERFLAAETRDRAVAGELTAETFASVLRGVRGFRGTTDAEAVAWLYGIARNLARNWRRRGRIESAARARLQMPLRDPADYASEADDRIAAAVLGSDLDRAVRALPTDQRAAVELRVLEQLSYAEVASRLACTEATARQRVARGLRTLKDGLQ
jgi:RNA polymerase sigma-70 factor (ECF subfamily)